MELIEADQEPGPPTEEIVAEARRAVDDAWSSLSRLVGTSWKKPHAAALVHKREAQRTAKATQAVLWQSDLVGHLLAGLSAANREGQDVWARSGPRRAPAGIKCSFCGKPDRTPERLIGGPGVTICNECVELCVWMLAEPGGADRP